MASPSSPLLSPRLKALAETLHHRPEDQAGTLDAFWNAITREGAPLIELADPERQRALVTFLWRATAPLASVEVRESFSWRAPHERTLRRLGETNVWHLSWWVDLTIFGSYGFVVRQPGERVDTTVPHPPTVPDPFNQHQEYSDWGVDEIDSLLIMPQARPLPAVPPRNTSLHGMLHTAHFTSAILQNERPLWVYTPPEYQANTTGYPFVIIFDGEPFHSGVRLLDSLIGAGELPPLVAILVNQIGIRNTELPCNPDFADAIATELVPWARDRWQLTADPARSALTGRSFGGLCSAYTALRHPGVFGNVFMQSGSCWYHPSVMPGFANREGGQAVTAGRPAAIPSIIAAYMQAPVAPIRIYQQCGNVENGPPPARIWQTFGNRWFHDVLTLKGYDTTYVEYAGGHDDAWWRPTFPDGIRWLFGSRAESPPATTAG